MPCTRNEAEMCHVSTQHNKTSGGGRMGELFNRNEAEMSGHKQKPNEGSWVNCQKQHKLSVFIEEFINQASPPCVLCMLDLR